ncbi:MAG: hypothetical protein F9K44_04255 [Hyphomicrobiaceae bacterium]|nr:MAG: hypothetical protein F9K44_04255 [Hyphomicrobiaceae bacterium]
MKWTVEFSPMIPELLYWGAVAAGLILVAVLLFRRTRGAILRALSLALLLGALANPTLKEEERESLSNIAVVVLDESISQSIGGRPERLKAVKADIEAKLGKIPGLEVRFVASPHSEEEAKDGTFLFTDLNRALANVPPDRIAGVIFITDGQVHDVPASLSAVGIDAPLHALLTGAANEFDRRIEILKAPRYSIVGSERDIEFRVTEQGRNSSGEVVEVKIRREGRNDETRRVRIGDKVVTKMAFPHAGQNIVELEVEAARGELTAANNRVVVAAEGVRENLRVLLVSGEPHAGERTWRNLLKSDAAVDLVHFTILRPPEKQDGTPIMQLSLIAFPTRELFQDKIKDFDLIIFDRYQRRNLLPLFYFENIARYVEQHGGALLVAAGDDYAQTNPLQGLSLYRTPLAPVLPAAPTGNTIERPFKALLSQDGLKHPVTRGLPGADIKDPKWGKWFRLIEVEPNFKGRAIMSGPDSKPLLILDRKGKGRVALMLSDHAWLWARGYDGGGPHSDLLRRLSHWLMKEPDLEEEALRASVRGRTITIERRSMETSVAPVTVTGPAGDKREVTVKPSGPGLWTETIEAKVPGLYKLQSGNLTAVAHVGSDNPREMAEVVATADKLKPIVDESGGGIFWTARQSGEGTDPTDIETPRVTLVAGAKVLAGSGWLGLKDREAYVTRGVKLTPMFTGLIALAALLFMLAATWWREGR